MFKGSKSYTCMTNGVLMQYMTKYSRISSYIWNPAPYMTKFSRISSYIRNPSPYSTKYSRISSYIRNPARYIYHIFV